METADRGVGGGTGGLLVHTQTLHGSQRITANEGLVHPCVHSHYCVPETKKNTSVSSLNQNEQTSTLKLSLMKIKAGKEINM